MSDPIEVWIAMNESGEYEVGPDEDAAIERFDDSVGGSMRRLVRLKVAITPPAVTEVDVTVPDEAGQTVNVEIGLTGAGPFHAQGWGRQFVHTIKATEVATIRAAPGIQY